MKHRNKKWKREDMRPKKKQRETVLEVGKTIALAVTSAVLLAKLFRLWYRWIPILLVIFLPGAYLIRKKLRQKRYRDRRFEQCADYLQQMIFSFEKTSEITASLREVRGFYGEDEMGRSLDEALDYLETTYSGNSKEVALKIIEEKFPCRILNTVHKFLLEAETTGGRMDHSLEILKEELQRYRTRIKLFQNQCRKNRINIIAAILAGLLLCVSLLYLTPKAEALCGFFAYQMGTVLMLTFSMLILYGAFCLTCRDWLEEKGTYSPKELEEKLLKYLNNTQKVGRRTLKSILQKEINLSYPDWILKLTLLLQNRDVPGAIEESIRDADTVLKYYLQRLAEGIHDHPDSPAPYLDFLEEFKTPETENAMKMIYTISTGGCVDADKQLAWLFDRTQVMEEQAAQIRQENQTAKMYVLFLAPTLGASLKLILDMSILLVSFMGQMGM